MNQLTEIGQLCYRYDDSSMVFGGFFGNSSMDPIIYKVCKLTKKGCWVKANYGFKKHLIVHSHKKQFAYATKELALYAYMKRKERQVAILKAQLESATYNLQQALEVYNEGSYNN